MVSSLSIIYRKLYRYYFHPRLYIESINKRKGECKRCGACCRNLFNAGIRCLFLKKDNLCAIHKLRKYIFILRPLCYFDPIEEFKTHREDYQDCGYYWDKEEIS